MTKDEGPRYKCSCQVNTKNGGLQHGYYHLSDQKQGVETLLECTPAYLGRDPLLLRRLSEASCLGIVTNTGYYGAARDIAVPKHAYTETPQQLAARWTAEFERGIEGTGIRPGFVKIGVDAGALSPIDRKLVEAGAHTHLATGLTLAIHTGDGRAALEILGVLAALGVAPEAYVWVHAQSEPDRATRAWSAMQGAWVELDGISRQSLDAHVDAVVDLPDPRQGHRESTRRWHDAHPSAPRGRSGR